MRELLLFVGMVFYGFGMFILGVNSVKPQIIEKCIYETEIIYRDTCDSQFLKAIGMVESRWNLHAVGDSGKAKGFLQIHSACVRDVNAYYGCNYTHNDMFNPQYATDVFWKYLVLVGLYQRKNGVNLSYSSLATGWNGGYKGYWNPRTKPYVRKFSKEFES